MKYRIGDVSRMLSIPVETLRFFEKHEIIVPNKNPQNRYRSYESIHLNRVVAYKWMRSMKLSMEQSIQCLKGSHGDLADAVNDKVRELQETVRYYSCLIERLEDINKALKDIDGLTNTAVMETSPCFWFFSNQTNNKFELEDVYQETTALWLSQLPFIWLALHIPKEEIKDGGNIRWGYALDTKYKDVASILDATKKDVLLPRSCLHTILRREGDAPLSVRCLQKFYFALTGQTLEPKGDIVGWILNEDTSGAEVYRYFELWFPV